MAATPLSTTWNWLGQNEMSKKEERILFVCTFENQFFFSASRLYRIDIHTHTLPFLFRHRFWVLSRSFSITSFICALNDLCVHGTAHSNELNTYLFFTCLCHQVYNFPVFFHLSQQFFVVQVYVCARANVCVCACFSFFGTYEMHWHIYRSIKPKKKNWITPRWWSRTNESKSSKKNEEEIIRSR